MRLSAIVKKNVFDKVKSIKFIPVQIIRNAVIVEQIPPSVRSRKCVKGLLSSSLIEKLFI